MTKARVDRQRQMLREADEELEILRREIKSETPPEIELHADAPMGAWLARITQWVENRISAIAAWDDLRRAISNAEEAKAALATEEDSLAETLITVGIDVDGLGLAALMQAADNVLADHAALQTKRTEADKRLGDLEAARAQRKKALEKAVTAFEEWQRAWTAVLATTWFADQQCESACKIGSDSILMQTDRVLALVSIGESV